MSGSKKYFVLVIAILLQLASSLNGHLNLDLNEVIKSKCSEDGWSLIDSETIANPVKLIPAKLLKASSISCASFQINLTYSGCLDISVYVDSSSTYSGLVILIYDEVSGPLTDYEYRMSNEDFEQGWHIISLPIEKRLNAEVTLLGFSDGEDIVLIDSIKYNKKTLKLHEDSTKTYAKTKVIDLVSKEYIVYRVRNPDNDINSIRQEKSNENNYDLSEVSLKQNSGELQLIEVDKLEHTENNEGNPSEKIMNEQSKRSVSAVDDDNEDENEGTSNGENNNAVDNDGDDENGEGGDWENEDWMGDSEGSSGHGEDGNGEDNGENGNGEDDNDNGENGNGENGNGEDGNGNGEDGNGEDNGDGNGEDGNGDGDNGENGNGEDGNGENGNGENESAETGEVSQPDTSFWNTWTILLISVGSATVLGLVLAAAYHLGKVRGRDIPPPIDLSELEAPRIIPRVKSARPAYDRFGGSECGGESSPELFSR